VFTSFEIAIEALPKIHEHIVVNEGNYLALSVLQNRGSLGIELPPPYRKNDFDRDMLEVRPLGCFASAIEFFKKEISGGKECFVPLCTVGTEALVGKILLIL
jgi:hypothetical protein